MTAISLWDHRNKKIHFQKHKKIQFEMQHHDDTAVVHDPLQTEAS